MKVKEITMKQYAVLLEIKLDAHSHGKIRTGYDKYSFTVVFDNEPSTIYCILKDEVNDG